jgi:transaldolase/glucose-6-phosphate isomerase
MSVSAEVNSRLAALTEAGTSVWLDQIRRNLIESGELERLMVQDSLRGVTSNPSIFEKAILGSDDYDAELEALAREGLDAHAIYDRIAVTDVQLAADVLRPVWDGTGGGDGFVSLEVSPVHALDTEGTLEQARYYWASVDRPNLMIKIPGTTEGVPAIEQAIYEGLNINVTLLFSVQSYANIAEAYIRGLERRLEEGKSLDMRSVASFFVSRVDTEVDKRLTAMRRPDLLGTAALANARAAYQAFKQVFYGERFASLREAGARVQRPLWASTGVKNPHYRDTMYVEGLVGPDTVNTMPMATLGAMADHGEVTGATADQDPSAELAALADTGIDLEEVTEKLLVDGIELFKQSMEGLIKGVDDRREGVVIGRPPTVSSVIPDDLEPAIAAMVEKAAAEQVARRIWRKDETLWGKPGQPEIADRLGWLTISEPMLEHVGELHAFVAECLNDGLTDAVLLGMGGSSLGPEVIRRTFGEIEGAMRLRVLDSTDPEAVLEMDRTVDLEKTLFIVASKSGGTIETLSHFKHFYARVSDAIGEPEAGSRFVTITDPGSRLVDLANAHGFRRVFQNDPDIGGRYSVLSYFGLVPAACMGVAVETLLQRAQVAEQNCTSYDRSSNNSGLWLGIVMGALARDGRDKLTFLVSEPISSFGLWVEQLIAESLGKQGRGVVPIVDEPVGGPESYAEDRVFVYLRNADEPDEQLDHRVRALSDAGHATVTLSVHGAADLGRMFFFAEFATAVAGWALGVNPFDQPDVQLAKDHTNQVLATYESEGSLPVVPEADDQALRALLGGASPPHYIAILGYLRPSGDLDHTVSELREAVREHTGCAVTFGYGPRFQHSTGQLHKGGPPTGVFLQLVRDATDDLPIPGERYTFGVLEHAAATGDLYALRERDLPAERVRLEGDSLQALRGLTARLRSLLG